MDETSLVKSGPAAVEPVSNGRQAETDEDCIDLWLRLKRSPKTRKEYARDVKAFREFNGFLPLAGTGTRHLQDYAEKLAASGLAPASQARSLSALKSLFTFAHRIGYLPFNVGAVILTPKWKDERAHRILSEESVMRLILAEPKFRNQLIIRTLFITGARLAEVRLLRFKDLQSIEAAGTITIFGKGGKTRVLRVPPRLFADLQSLDVGKSEFIFSNPSGGPLSSIVIWRMVKRAAKKAELDPNISCHWLRHGHASAALARGASLKLIQESLGHANLNTTGIYLHARPEDSSALYLGID